MKEIQKLKNARGITLVALVVTIIVLIILAGVSIYMVLGQNGIITKSKEASKAQEIAEITEQAQMEIVAKEAEKLSKGESITKAELEAILSKYGTINYEEDGTTIKSITTQKGYEILLSQIWKGTIKEGGNTEDDEKTEVVIVADGSFNGTLHTPKIENTGLTAVYWDGANWVDLTEESLQEEWDNWYNYADTSVEGEGKSNWANARSADGSMWVWIPRYEYKIDSENKTIDVNFIKIGDNTTEGYTLHPAFGTDIDNGGWSEDLPGFWVAKYEAGFQNGTVGEETKEVVYSPTLKYTIVNGSINFLGTMTANTTPLSYPVFKANTYSYNYISVADAWLLSQEIATASMYGLSNVDSHMQKNSEWGAVAYLTHSKYGLNGQEVTINSKNLSNSIYVNNATSGTRGQVYAVTSYGDSDIPNDVNASSTKNMTGVFDLSGGTWEKTAGYLKGGAASTLAWHNAMASSNTNTSTKYLTLYTANEKKGDATNETAGWNSDYSNFVTSSYPVFIRGGDFYNGDSAGVFAFDNVTGGPYNNDGFRACLVFSTLIDK